MSPIKLIPVSFLILFTCAMAYAEPPTKNSLANITIGTSPQVVIDTLMRLYPKCRIGASMYKPDKAGNEPYARVAINPGTPLEDPACEESQRESGKIDSITVSFLHSSKNSESPAYQIELNRVILDPKLLNPLMSVSVENLSETLEKEFGEPIHTTFGVDRESLEFMRMMSRLSKEKPPTEFPYASKMTWMKALPNKKSYGLCTPELCGRITLTADITGKGKPKSNKTQVRATSVVLKMLDEAWASEQISWSTKMDEDRANAIKSF